MDYQAVKDEVTNNPKSIPDLSWGQTDGWIRDTLNTLGISSEITDRGVIDAHEVVSAVVISELNAVSDKQQDILAFIVSAGQVNTSSAEVKSIFADIFGAGTTTRTNLLALATRPASRAEVLPGVNQNLSSLDVHIARRL